MALALAVTGLALTHYFSLGVIAAAALYAGLRFPGRKSRSVLAAMVASLFFVTVIWAPFAWHTRHQFIVPSDFGKMGVSLAAAVIGAPRKLVFGQLGSPIDKAIDGSALAFLVYFSPAFRIGKDPRLLAPGCGPSAALDSSSPWISWPYAVRKYPQIHLSCSPACYLILASPWGKGVGRLLPPTLFLATILFGVDRWQSGPQVLENSATLEQLITQKVGDNDAVIIIGRFEIEPAFNISRSPTMREIGGIPSCS